MCVRARGRPSDDSSHIHLEANPKFYLCLSIPFLLVFSFPRKIFKTLGHPTSQTWPNWQSLPLAKSLAANGSSCVNPPLYLPFPLAPSILTTTADSLVRFTLGPNLFRYNHLPNRFKNHMTQAGHDLLSALLCYDPKARISAEDAMRHPYFS